MTEYIDELTNYSTLIFGERVTTDGYSCAEKTLQDLHRLLDLPEAITAQVTRIISNTSSEQKELRPRIWGLTVIELYLLLIAGMSETDRNNARQFIKVGEREFRLARMCMLIWLHPVEAPRITRSLAEAPVKWLHLDGYRNQPALEARIAEQLMEFSATLHDLHMRMTEHVQSLQSKCLYDFYTSA